jgi:NTE family protein
MALLRRTSKFDSGLDVPPARSQVLRTTNEGILQLASRLPRPAHWVLAGGGAHGAVQWGTLQAVRETDLTPDALVGTSAGALTGAMIAEDPVAAVTRLGYLWSSMDLTDILPDGWLGMVRPTNITRSSLADSAGERATLERVFQSRDFEDLVLPLAAVATDLDSGQPTALAAGSLLDALLASSAIPGVFPPVEIDGRYYVDGLASANLPAAVAVDRGAASIVVFDTGTSAERNVGPSLAQVVPAINAMLAAQQRLASLRAAAEQVPVVYLPTPGGLAGSLDFAGSISSARSAYELARAFLTDLHALAGEGVLSPGLYARPDAFDAGAPDLDDVLRAVVGER